MDFYHLRNAIDELNENDRHRLFLGMIKDYNLDDHREMEIFHCHVCNYKLIIVDDTTYDRRYIGCTRNQCNLHICENCVGTLYPEYYDNDIFDAADYYNNYVCEYHKNPTLFTLIYLHITQ